MKFILLAIAFTIALASADDVKEVKLTLGQVYTELKNPEYPGVHSGDQTLAWKFESEEGTKIQIKCTDFRFTQSEDCKTVGLVIDYGDSKKTVCSHYEEFKTISTSNTLTVILEGDATGLAVFNCYVKTTEPAAVEEVAVKLNEVYNFGSPYSTGKGAAPFFDKLWQLKAEEGYQVDLTCHVALMETDPCTDEVLTVDLGDGPNEYCGYEKLQFYSKGNEAKVRIELDKKGKGRVLCLAQAAIKIDEANDKEAATRIDVEDSSEHGGAAGVKGTTCRCGWANKPRARVIRGKEASPNEYPWMVALRARFGRAVAGCGASIVTKRHVITAAHCLININGDMRPVLPQDLKVIIGAHDPDRGLPRKHYVVHDVERHFIRPEFPMMMTHDFAVIILKKEIKFTDTVGPICLSPKNIAEANRRITIMGWGLTERSQPSSVLLKGKTTVIQRNLCRIAPWEICTQTRESATCSGDSGGPLVWLDPETNRYTQVSLVSHGHPDCVSSPSVSTDVSYFYKYLQDVIAATYPEEVICTKK